MFSRRIIQLFFAISLFLLAGAGAAGNYSNPVQQSLPVATGISSKKNPLKNPERISPVAVSLVQVSIQKKVNGGEACPVLLNGFTHSGTAVIQAQGHLNSHKAYLFFIYPSHHFW